MYLIIYNPKSKGGNRDKILDGVIKLLGDEEYVTKSFGDIKTFKEFIDELKDDEYPLIVGGDGTLHFIANIMKRDNITKDVYAYSSGTGNDFFRDINQFNKIVKINDYLENLPTCTINGEEEYFLNGTGIGLDALVCHLVNESKCTNAFSYTMAAIKAFFKFKPSKMTAFIDGKQTTYDKCWLVSSMNGKYQGGGMMFAPDKIRNDGTIGTLFIHDCSRLKILFLFLSIYKGKQFKYKKYVNYFVGSEVKLIPGSKVYVQTDGEVTSDFKDVIIKGQK